MTIEERNNLALENMGLVYSIVNRYGSYRIDQEELEQVGFIGLLDGIEKYDERSTTKLSTYVYYWIKARVLAHINKNSFAVNVSKSLTSKQIENLGLEYTSMDDEVDLHDTIPAPSIFDDCILRLAIDELPESHRAVIEAKLTQVSFVKLAKEKGCSKQLVHKIYKQALSMLRQKLRNRNIRSIGDYYDFST